MSSCTRLLAALTAGATLLWLAGTPLMAAPTAPPPAPAHAKPGSTAPLAPPAPKVQLPSLTAAQIMEKHIAARGGAQAWKEVQSLQISGKMDAGRGDNYARAMKIVDAAKKESGKGTTAEVTAANGPKPDSAQVALPFTLDLKRPNKSRLEIQFAGKTAVQVYDGEHGWKLRPFLNHTDAEPFTADEAKSEASRDALDGPLIGSTSNGAKVSLEGTDLVDGQPAYRLKVTHKNGDVKHVWIDGKTFLDIKMDGFAHRMDGKARAVYVYQRDFRSVQGVIIPFEMETVVDGYPDKHKMIIEKAAINQHFDEALFAKPHA